MNKGKIEIFVKYLRVDLGIVKIGINEKPISA